MFVRFWGTRGSIPTPGPDTTVYGGNTSCVEIRTDDGTTIILDCGTGIRELGSQLLKSGNLPPCIYMLIGHTHWDHIQGFPFFTPVFLPGIEFNIFAPAGFQRSLEDSLAGQMQYSYFPVKLQELSSLIHYRELEEGFFRIGGDVLVETQYLNHTAPTVAYRITSGGATVAYVTDHEPFWNSSGPEFHHPGDQRHIEFLKGCDLVIHDAQYTSEEYRTKIGWGHSTVDYATDVAIAAEVGRLALFHHDPSHDDNTIRRLEEYARKRAETAGSVVEVFAAAEGMELEVKGGALSAGVIQRSALERRSIDRGRVLVITDAQSDISAIEHALAEEGLIVSSMGDDQTALERIPQLAPDLVILNSKLAGGDGVRFIEPIRSLLRRPQLPILILTEHPESSATLGGAETIATDYFATPFSPPMLRSRVRAWLARTMDAARAPSAPMEDPESLLPSAQMRIQDTGLADMLASVRLFRPLSPEQLATLLRRSVQQFFPAGHTIVRQGEPAQNVYVTLSGRVRMTETLPDRLLEVFAGELGPGEVFGDLGILCECPHSATIVTLEGANCLIIPEEHFVKALNSSAEMSLSLLRVVAGRLYEADRLLSRYAPDPLTGLPGRQAFHELYRPLAAGARRRHSSVLLLALDVVDLRSINEQFGYGAGNDVLRTVADALIESSRITDLVSRYGGDEFAALLVEADDKPADAIVERVRSKINALAEQRSIPLKVECSIGYATSQAPPDSIEELLRAADQNMQTNRRRATS